MRKLIVLALVCFLGLTGCSGSDIRIEFDSSQISEMGTIIGVDGKTETNTESYFGEVRANSDFIKDIVLKDDKFKDFVDDIIKEIEGDILPKTNAVRVANFNVYDDENVAKASVMVTFFENGDIGASLSEVTEDNMYVFIKNISIK